jgi:hypothetical protein
LSFSRATKLPQADSAQLKNKRNNPRGGNIFLFF